VWPATRVGPEERNELKERDQVTITREWSLASGTDMANATYRSSNSDGAAADIVDCEAMVRSIRFER
jgi:hypothetical protein